ncbi:hypothetical protein NOGI109294_03060 [Nocardiopsis gilva]|uniref:hypothetical protein n=1 Tax=Nocardiopsis gilva TaxID=280236 RepID=UPI0003480070|nr:hypothetical protein [Nocardiopsis gilva]
MSQLFFGLMVVTLLTAGVLLLWSFTQSRGAPLTSEVNRALIILAAAAVALAVASLLTA